MTKSQISKLKASRLCGIHDAVITHSSQAASGQNKNFQLRKYSQPITHNSQLISGFTLIEILVAATIIGLLSTIGFAGFQAITRSGRDALRKSDLEAIRSALEIYKAENNQYPNSYPTLVPDYISPYPADPKSPTYNYWYQRKPSNALQYTLCAHLENGSGDYDADCCTGVCASDLCGSEVNCNYKVTNP